MNYKTWTLFIVTVSAVYPAATSAQVSSDSLMKGELPVIVVTATRTPHQLENVPVPTQVVSRQEILARGAVRLPEILAGQTGLMLHSDHGTGIQMQGLGPEYTSILVDGVRMIGRTAGTLELNRITLNNVERIEIIRGPSSSLYGSEALAGVVNIITARPDSALEGSFRARYGTHETSDVSAYVGGRHRKYAASLFVNRHASGGYDLDRATIGLTSPEFSDYTFQSRMMARATERMTLRVDGRANIQHQDNPILVTVENDGVPMTDRARQIDWNVAPSLTQRIGANYLMTVRANVSRFSNRNETHRVDDGALHFSEEYAHQYAEGEATMEGYVDDDHQLIAGIGYIDESVAADRVSGRRRSIFGFVQDEWRPSVRLDVVASARFDAPSDYDARLSPKIALLYRATEALRVRLSVGSGYKAPAFRQLYLDFTNPTVGYSVLGATEVLAGLDRLQQEGQIAEVYISDPDGGPLESESSIAFNAEVAYQRTSGARLKIGVFRNNVQDLIDTRPIAVKHNGQQVFSYFNLDRVYTQGVEAELSLPIRSRLSLRFGYQYLDTADRGVLDRIDAGEIFTRVDNRDRVMTRDDYGGLMQRSRHQGTIQVSYTADRHGLTAMLTSRLRSRYGFADINGNGVLDVAAEYIDGYGIWNFTLSKDFRRFTVRAGVDNFTSVRPAYVPALSGARFFGAVELSF